MKSMRTIYILVGVSSVVIIGFAAYDTLWGSGSLHFSRWDLLIMSALLILFGVLERPFLRIRFPAEIKNGVTAQAKVLKVWDTGVTINDDPQVGLLLEVSSAGGNPFQAKAKTIVSRLNVALVQPGITAQVKYDPQKPQRLQVLALHGQSADTTDAATRLEQLNTLRDKGLISEEEYRQKREDILGTL